MRVMTVNLLNGAASPAALQRVLETFDPDVLMAQELAPNAGVVIEQHFAHGVVKPGTDFNGRALAAAFPISVADLDFPFRPALQARTRVDGHDLEILNVHLANPIDGWRGKLPERRAQVAQLERLIAEPRRRVVAGDFNSSPWWPAYRRLVQSLDDTIGDLAVATGSKPANTWGWRPGWRTMLRIDHVFATGLRATASQVVDVAGSDHKAVVADLEFT